MPYIEQYTAMSVTSASTYFITSEGNVYYKLNRDTFYNELQGLFGTSIGALATLSDVDVTGLVTGSLLRYNGSQWVDTAVADYFQNGGNAGGAARTLGNTDNYNLGFKTNNVERLRILDTGEVGIGSTTDNDIDDAQLFVQSSKSKNVIIYNADDTQTNMLSFQREVGATARREVFHIEVETDGASGSENAFITFTKREGGTLIPSFALYAYSMDGGSTWEDLPCVWVNGGEYDAILSVGSGSYNGTTPVLPSALSMFKISSGYSVDSSSSTVAGLDIRANGDVYLPSDTGVVIGSQTRNASAMLEIVSTTKGFRLPNMTTTQRDAISSPATGLLIYNTSTSAVNLYNGAWVAI